MIGQRKLTTKRQVVRHFHELLALCDMDPGEYIDALRTLSELANDLADDEMIVQRIAAIRDDESQVPTIWRFPSLS
jgi:hypothetical protein